MELFDITAQQCSRLITQAYSTSFTLGIKTLDKRLHLPIYSIYGFVRFADEIVDTFHGFDKKDLLDRFEKETYQAIDEKISLNPVLHAFQLIVNEYKIEKALITAFLDSMRMDLDFSTYSDEKYKTYIYGSAEVVGLMCLRVFCVDQNEQYDKLKNAACSLGSAFQKVNFLRDIKSDFDERGRVYFPDVNFNNFTENEKRKIEADIEKDFAAGYQGILGLPNEAKLGVLLAYKYYLKLFKKIKNASPATIQAQRVRVPDYQKFSLLTLTYLKFKLN